MVQYLDHRMNCACFGIISAVYQAFYPCMHQRPCAHGARLNRGKQFAIPQAVVAQVRTRLAKGNNFGMGGRVGVREVAIPASTYDLASMHDHCADWNFARFQRSLCGADSLFHPEFVRDRGWSFFVGRSSLVRGHGVYRYCIGFGKRGVVRLGGWKSCVLPVDGGAG
jgi:hypothetical protein